MERKDCTTKLYNRILEYEERMDNLRFDLAASIRAGDHKRTVWFECRYFLRLFHEELLLDDIEFVEKGSLLCSLWNRLYYGPVERMRAALGKIEDQEILRNDILSVIDEGIGYFMILVYHLKRVNASQKISPTAPNFEAPKARVGGVGVDSEIIVRLVYECFIYLGDLSRYKCSFEHDSLLIAEGYYFQAVSALLTHGHAYNQLAVLYCLQENLLEGIFYYLKATMSIKAFPKGADNLLTLCRRIINVSEDRLGLSEEPALAALFGLLLRLVSTVIVHELARNSQMSHIESITAGLNSLLVPSSSQILDTMTQADEKVFVLLFGIVILGVEFLQKSSPLAKEVDFPSQQYLSGGQVRLVDWLLICSDRVMQRGKLTSPRLHGMRSISLLCLWMVKSDIIERINNTRMDSIHNATLHNSLKDFLRSLVAFVNAHVGKAVATDTKKMVIDDQLLVGIRSIGNTCEALPGLDYVSRLNVTADHLCRKHLLLIYEDETSAYSLREDYEKMVRRREAVNSVGQQRLSAQVPQHRTKTIGVLSAQWHLFDADVLLEHWERIEGLLKVGAIRLIITLSTLRHLDFVKSNKGKMGRARRIMRSIAMYNRTKNGCIHLQHPKETTTLPPGTADLSKHHRALLSAFMYFNDPELDFVPIWILSADHQFRRILDTLSIDYVSEISLHLSKL